MKKSQKVEMLSNTALTISILSLIAWLIPIVGVPVGILGIVYAVRAGNHPRATVALTLCILSLIASGVNAYTGYQNGVRLRNEIQTNNNSSMSEQPAVTQSSDERGYTQNHETNFVTECMTQGSDYSWCKCGYDWLKAAYTLEEAVQYEAKGKFPELYYETVAANCV
jgi:hypothetical protein